jgi:hypothetical protein
MTRQVYRALFVCGGCGDRVVKYVKARRIVFPITRCTCGSMARFEDGKVITVKHGSLSHRLSHA